MLREVVIIVWIVSVPFLRLWVAGSAALSGLVNFIVYFIFGRLKVSFVINLPWFISFLEFGDHFAVLCSVFIDSLLKNVVKFASLFRFNQFQEGTNKNDCGPGTDATSPLVSLHLLVLEYAWKVDLEQDMCSAGSE